MKLIHSDKVLLQQNSNILENPGIAIRLGQLIGTPMEKALTALPANWSEIIETITKTALNKAIDSALLTLDNQHTNPASNSTHKLLAGLSGAVGGTFGLSALAVELPISTTIMLRSIADIARSEGEDIQSLETKMACLEVFALGGAQSPGDSSDTVYYAVRSLISRSMSDSAAYIAQKGLSKDGAPALIKVLNIVASRFHIPVSQKLAAQSVPAIGAIGGASVNLIFMSHFQDMARAHFSIRKLERTYGADVIRHAYQQITD